MSHWCCACHATSITCHHMSHWCCACYARSHCNVPFPAPANPEPRSNATRMLQSPAPNVTLVLRLPRNVNHLPPHVTLVLRLPRNVTLQRTSPCTSHPEPRCSWKCHVYKRSNFTCTSEPISRAQANPRPLAFIHVHPQSKMNWLSCRCCIVSGKIRFETVDVMSFYCFQPNFSSVIMLWQLLTYLANSIYIYMQHMHANAEFWKAGKCDQAYSRLIPYWKRCFQCVETWLQSRRNEKPKSNTQEILLALKRRATKYRLGNM